MEYISREELMRTLKPFVINKGVMENVKAIPNVDVIPVEWLLFNGYSDVVKAYKEEE